MNTAPAQRGSLLITSVVLIAVIGALAAALSFMFASNVGSSASHLNSAQALMVAEAGLERALYAYKGGRGRSCALLTYNSSTTPGASVGQGSFSTTGTLFTPASTTLSANITASQTIIPVASTAGYAARGRITINSEDINYDAIGTTTASCALLGTYCFTGALRGAGVNPAAGASANDIVSQSQCQIVSTGTVNTAVRTIENTVVVPRAMIVYSKGTINTTAPIPYYRRWIGGAWRAEGQAQPASGTINREIRFMVLKFSRTRDEAILGTLTSDNNIRVQVWNGATATWGNSLDVATNVDNNVRNFDIEYETLNDRAIVVYNSNNNATIPQYRIWTGTAWLAGSNVSGTPAGITRPRWIDLAAHPFNNSNDIVMMVLDNNNNVYGLLWNGSTWVNMGGGVATLWGSGNTGPSNSTSNSMAVAYEQNSGRAIFVWGVQTNGGHLVRTYNNGALSAAATYNTNGTKQPQWLHLAARNESNELLLGSQDSNPTLYITEWNDITGFTAPATSLGATYTTNSRNFDLAYEEIISSVLPVYRVVWGNSTTNNVTRRRVQNTTANITTQGDRTDYVQLVEHRHSGTVFAALYEAQGSTTRDILAMQSTATPPTFWTATTQIWGGPTTDPSYEQVAFAAERYAPSIEWREIFP